MKIDHTLEQVPPHNIEAEMSVLGAMLIDNSCIPKVSQMLSKNHFYKTLHQELAQTILALHSKGCPVDLVTLREDLKKKGLLELIDEAHLIELEGCVPNASSVEYYAKIVLEKAIKREQIVLLREGLRLGYEDAVSSEEINKKISSFIESKTAEASISQIKISTIDDMLQYEQPEYLIKPILYKNTVNLLTSLPGVGKSVLAFSIANAIANAKPLWGNLSEVKGGSVLLIDEENPGSIHRGRIEKMGISKDVPIHFVHYAGVKVDDSRWLDALIKVINEGKYVLVIFDALIRMHSAKENDSDEMSKVMQGFREIVKKTDATVLIIHHERKSRNGERRERSRGSGDIVGAIDCQLILEEGLETDDGKELILHPGKMRLKSFAPIRLVLNSDTLDIYYVGTALSSNKGIIKSVVQFLGDDIKDFEEIQQALGVPEKQLRTIIKNALGQELILDSTPRNQPGYTGSPKKQFYKVNPAYLFSNVAMFPPIGG